MIVIVTNMFMYTLVYIFIGLRQVRMRYKSCGLPLFLPVLKNEKISYLQIKNRIIDTLKPFVTQNLTRITF